MSINCPHCQNPTDFSAAVTADILCTSCGLSFRPGIEATAAWNPSAEERKLGKFELIDIVGVGAFGTVYKARDPELDRVVAIKVPRTGNLGGSSSGDADRFLREARSVARLRHPAIVPVHEVGQANGQPYLVSDFVDGITLEDLLSARKPTPREAAKLLAALTDALQYAHENGVVHRDVKPGNIMLELSPKGKERDTSGHDQQLRGSHAPLSEYTPRLMDFGLAKRDGAEIAMTMEGQVLGTPAYMSPEQARGDSHTVDGRCDVYSLGIILYRMLTGELPFRGTTRMLLHQVLHDEPRPPRRLNDRVPRDLETICLRAIAKEPGRRYATARALADDLRRFLKGEAIQARPISKPEKLWRWCRRNPTVAGLTAAVFLLLALVAVVASIGYIREAHQREEAERQGNLALASEAKALDAEAGALEEAARTRRLLYDANMNLAQQAGENHSLVRLQQLLAETQDYADRGFEWYYWQRQCHLELLTLRGHSGDVASVAFAPDGKRLVTGSGDRTAKVWDAVSGREILTLRGPVNRVTSVTFSSDGSRILGGSSDGTARVWDTVAGRQLLAFRPYAGTVASVAFSSDDRYVVIGSADGAARVWDVTAQGQPLVLKGHTAGVTSAAFSPNGKRVVTGSGDSTARLWHTATGQVIFILKGHVSGVTSAAFSPNGERVVTGGGDGTARLWDAATGQERLIFKGHTSGVTSVAFSPNGDHIVTGSSDGTARLWDAATGRQILIFKGHASGIASVAFSPRGDRIVTGSSDGTTRLWDAVLGGEPPTPKGDPNGVRIALSPDGRHIVTGNTDGTAQLWEVATGLEKRVLKGHASQINAVAFSADGQRIVTGSSDGTAKVWNADTGQETISLKRHEGQVSSVAFSLDGRHIVTGSFDSTARIWDAASGHEILTLPAAAGWVYAVAFSPDGDRIATGGTNKSAKVWDAATGRVILSFNGHAAAVTSIAFSADGKHLITGSYDRTARIWDAATGREILVFTGHTSEVSAAAFLPGGNRIVTCSGDGTARLWDTATGREVLTFRKQRGRVSSVGVSADGKRIVTGSGGLISISGEGTAHVWDAASPEQVAAWTAEERVGQVSLNVVAAKEQRERTALAREEGFLQDWLVVSPIPLATGQTGADGVDKEQIPSEAYLRPQAGDRIRIGGKELIWKKHQTGDYFVDFVAVSGDQQTDHSVALAVCYLVVEKEMKDLEIKIGSDDQAKIYLNAKEVFKSAAPRPLITDHNSIGPVTLHKGINVLVFKVLNESSQWQGCIRFVDKTGNPVKNIQVRLTPN